MTIPLTPIESSQLHAIGHDPETNTLAIQFKGKNGPGAVYHYANFDAKDFEAFKNAESKGKHFGAHIKNNPRHVFSKVG